MKADLRFGVERELSLNLTDGSIFSMPTSVTTGIVHDFEGEVSATTPEDAIKQAQEIADNISLLLSQELLVAVKDVWITLVQPINDSTNSLNLIGQAHITANAYIVRPFDIEPDAGINIQNNINAILASNSIRKSSVLWALSQMNQALRNNDSIVQFWAFYSILLVFKGSGRGDRMTIDRYIQSVDPSITLFRSDHDSNHVTVITAIRDAFSHPATFDGGQTFDPIMQARACNRKLTQIIRDLISQEINTL